MRQAMAFTWEVTVIAERESGETFKMQQTVSEKYEVLAPDAITALSMALDSLGLEAGAIRQLGAVRLRAMLIAPSARKMIGKASGR